MLIEFEPHEPASTAQGLSCRSEPTAERIHDQVATTGTVHDELVDEIFAELILVLDLAGFVVSGHGLYRETIMITVLLVSVFLIAVEGSFLLSAIRFGPEQHMIVTGYPFVLGAHTETVLSDDVIHFFEIGVMQSIQDVMQIGVA